MSNMIEFNSNFNKSIFLLILTISGNFIGDTFGCQSQYIIKKNIFAKHLMLLFIIYFTITYIGNEDIEPDPYNFMKSALIIWFTYVIFTKQNITFTTISGLLMMITYFLDGYVKYYDKKSKNIESKEIITNFNEEKKEKFIKYRNYTFYSTLVSVGVGFLLYFKEKKDEYKNNFSYITFILGKNECDSLK
jgi:hypothetical protein